MAHPYGVAILGIGLRQFRIQPRRLLQQDARTAPVRLRCSPASSTVPAKRSPFAIGVATNFASESVVGTRGITSGARNMAW